MSRGFSLLDREVQFLKGIGPKRAVALADAGIKNVRDLLHFYPRRYLDRSTITPFSEIGQLEQQVTVVGVVRSAAVVPSRRTRRFEVILEDEEGNTVQCVWFKGITWVQKSIAAGARIAVHGKPQPYNKRWSFPHPDYDLLDSEGPNLATGRIIPLYPGSDAFNKAGISGKTIRKTIYSLFKEDGLLLEEVLPAETVKKYGLMEGRVALRAIHFPNSEDEREKAVYRLKFEELFWIQLLLHKTHQLRDKRPGIVLETPGEHSTSFFEKSLPFTLTSDQQEALKVIYSDATSGKQMNRLLQGDVGSGKTIVAVGAILQAVDSGKQGVLMAPTEILAEQHYTKLRKYLQPIGLTVVLLRGGQKKAERDSVMDSISSGDAHVVIGTHAVIEDAVEFDDVGMIVIDEQHRFGVTQRGRLVSKGQNPHILLMSATPIPRSLAMTLYGDLDVTTIRQKPAGRKEIETRLLFEPKRESMYAELRRHVESGQQAYVVYPLVEESEKVDLRDAESGFELIKSKFPDRQVELIHGRMKTEVREEVMARFVSGECSILVSTTVIEVGVDVPNATVMIIEHAERFGLSQLHQLRGRVGRGSHSSICLLMADYKKTSVADERLAAMVDTNDGFRISELDLEIRGGGDFFGTRQSGLPDLKIADIVEDVEIIELARAAAGEYTQRTADSGDTKGTITDQYFERYVLNPKMEYAKIG